MIDLYPSETAEKLSGMAPVQVPEPRAWDGFVRGTGMYTMQGLAKTGRAVDMLGAVGPIAQDAFTGGTEAQDKYFREHDDVWGSAVDYWTPAPGEVGVAGQTVGQLLSLIPQVLASPSLAIGATQLGVAEDLVREGVDAGRANLVGGVNAVGLGLGIWLPILGRNLWQRVIIGGAGFNVVQGAATRGVSGEILQGTPQAEQFRAFDGTAMTLDVLLGMAFGGLVHLSPEARVQGAEAWGKIASWAEKLDPSQKDAIATLRQAQHMNVDSTPGEATTPADVEAHVNRLKTAIEQAERGQPVNVEDLPAGRFEPQPDRQLENLTQMDEMVRSAADVARAEGIQEPQVPDRMRISDEERATYESLHTLPREEQAEGVGQVIEAQLVKAGVPQPEALANAAIWRAFTQTIADRYGINPAEILTRYGVGVSRGTPIEGALDQPGSGPDQAAIPPADRTVEVDGVRHPVSNSEGKPIAGTVAELRNFYRWFGDSKVVDEKGRPLVVYHGTEADFEAFGRSEDIGFHFGTRAQATSRVSDEGRILEGARLMPVHLKIENPYRMPDLNIWEPGNVLTQLELDGILTREQANAADIVDREFVRNALAAKGYDGIVYKNGVEGKADPAADSYIVFSPEQIKSAIGNRGTFDPDDPNILYQSERGPTFYSALAHQVDAADMKAAPAKGWKDWVKGQVGKGGIKAEEVKWSGLEEWLDLQGGRVTKEAVQAFLANNGVRVDEVMLGDQRMLDYLPSEWTTRRDEDGNYVVYDESGEIIGDGGTPELAQNAARIYIETGQTLPTKFQQYQLPGGENYRELLLTLPEKPANVDVLEPDTSLWTKENVTLNLEQQGGGLRMTPTQRWTATINGQEYRITRYPGRDSSEFRVDGGNGQIQNSGAPTLEQAMVRAQFHRSHPEVMFVGGAFQAMDSGVRRGRGDATDFQSSHFDQPNILAHVRFNERTDADGKKVLFIEEFQSDWAQQGRKERTRIVESLAKERGIPVEEANRLVPQDAGFLRNGKQREPTDAEISEFFGLREGADPADYRLEMMQRTKPKGIPAAPFVGKTDAWVALALKRMIRYAAENGFDRVAWTRGEQQVERYTGALRKAVDAIEWTKTPEGIQIVGYKGKQSGEDQASIQIEIARVDRQIDALENAVSSIRQMSPEQRATYSELNNRHDELSGRYHAARGNRTKVVDTTQKEDTLSDAIGKAMADRIINDPAQSGTIEGENIRVDDTGMAGFYDRIVPKVANEVLKKLGGGKVRETDLDLRGGPLGAGFTYEGPRYTYDALDAIRPTMGNWPVQIQHQLIDVMTEMQLRGADFEDAIEHFGSRTLVENLGGQAVQLMETSKQASFDITPAMLEKALAGQPLFQQGRAQIQFGENRTLINLLETADRSSFMHETGHFFLQVSRDLASAPNAPIEAMQDWATTKAWLGLEGDTIPREAHEQFARGFEAYLREGNAPSPELKTVFQQFRDWLLALYESIASLDVKLTEPIRRVMDRMLASQRQDPGPGTPRSAPSGSELDDGQPPPPGAESAPAAFESLTIEAPDMRSAIEQMALHEAGWAQEGGKNLGGETGVANFSTWIPKADWWADRPDKLNAAKTQEAVRKALAGEKLKAAEQRMVDYLVEVANKRMAASKFIAPDEWGLLASDLASEGLEVNQKSMVQADQVARAIERDETAVEAAAIRYENDDAAFMAAVEEILRGNDPEQARQDSEENRGPAQSQGTGGQGLQEKPDPEQLLAQEAERYVLERPDQLLTIGTNPDGTPVQITAADYLTQARAAVAQAREDVALFDVAATCLMGRN